MDKQEARQLIQKELAYYEGKTYAELANLINQGFYFERSGLSGAQYQIEILITWDATPSRAILIIGSIDDGGWQAFSPLTESILKLPED